MLQDLRSFLNKKQAALLIAALIYDLLVFYGSRLINHGMEHHDFTLTIDHMIPLLPWMIFVYIGAFLFWVINYCICTKFDKGHGLRFIGTHFIGETVCLGFFLLLPTAMMRPEITGNSFADWALSVTYQSDSPDNLFPSLHCFMSWLCWIGVRGNDHIPKWYRNLSLVIAIAICISTLTVKQHVFVDAVAGVLLAEICYILSGMLDRRLDHKLN